MFEENADANERAEAIRREIKRLGLPGDITVQVQGSRVKVGGNVPDEATRQKLALIVGNVKHIDSVDDIAPAGGAQSQQQPTSDLRGPERRHAVGVAKRQYGDAGAYNRIFEANQPMLKDPDEIYPGQLLIIPGKDTAFLIRKLESEALTTDRRLVHAPDACRATWRSRERRRQ